MSRIHNWTWETRRGSAAELHEPSPPSVRGRTVWLMEVEGAALALGSSQAAADIDEAKTRAHAIECVRRRSGGGAVLLIPGDHVWIDAWLPAGDPLWVDDVGRAADWLGAAWIDALTEIGVPALTAHRGPMLASDWSGRVCFAGLGPGEVSTGGRKLVGVSQRRTREWARFQCLVHRRWDAEATFGLLAAPGAAAAAGEWSGRVADIGDAPIEAALVTAMDAARPVAFPTVD